MINMPTKELFQTRLARKTFFLIIISALLPLALLTALTYQQMNRIIENSHKDMLRSAAKSYGMAINDRLNLTAMQLGSIETSLSIELSAGDFVNEANTTYFNNIIVKWGKDNTALLGEPTLSNDDLKRLDDRSYLVLFEESPIRIWMIKKIKRSNKEGIIFASLSDFVWGESDSWDQNNLIVVRLDKGRELFQTTAQEAAEGSNYNSISKSWQLNLRPMFGAETLVITASDIRGGLISSAKKFNYYIALTTALAILLVTIITLALVRKNSEPVMRLKQGIESINNNDFSTRIKIDTDDEFAMIGDAFNNMAEKLGGQIHAMESLAEIDKMILKRIKKDEIIRIIIEQSQLVFDSKKTILLLKKESTKESYVVFYSGKQSFTEKEANLVDISEQLILGACNKNILQSIPQSVLGTIDDALHPLSTPIIVEDHPLAVMLTFYEFPPSTEKRVIIDTFADHVAVALTNSEWEKRLFYQAHYDSLTGLPNRHLALDRLGQAISAAGSNNNRVALLYVDLDEFKNANDSLGHQAGDKLLKIVATRFSKLIGKGDTLARLGGDEFVLIHTVKKNSPEEIIEECEEIAGGLIEVASRPVVLGEHNIISSASIGIAFYPEDARDVETILKHADIAMYHAKDRGKKNYQFYDSKLNKTAEANIKLFAEIHQAIRNDEFELYYQPKIYSRSLTGAGAEALIRWNHPRRGFLTPENFIPMAEHHGIINDIGNWVVDNAMKRKADWKKEGTKSGPISINISPKQIRRETFIPYVESKVREYGIEDGDIEFEITETAFIEDFELLKETMDRVRALGIGISIDDYGTGYASINLLVNLPIQKLKIDGSYISKLPESPRQCSVVESMINLAHSLDLSVVAECVENREQLNFLRDLGCEEIQGYFFSKPLPAQEYVTFVDKNKRVFDQQPPIFSQVGSW